MNWLSELVNQHSELESPKSFWYWSGLCAISAVVTDQVYMDCGGAYNLYPNIYVMLHADSGLKKGPPVALVKNLVKRVNSTRVISGRSSIQGILKKLGTAQTTPGGKISGKSVGFIIASEFSSSLVNDPAAMTILTDLYDRQWNEDEWESLLKMEEFKLKDPTVSMLVATNKAHFEDFIGKRDIHGGFIGRMFVIAETQVERLNPLIKRMTRVPDREGLSNYLRELSKLKGSFESLEDKPAGLLYEKWYLDFYGIVKEQRIEDETGTIQRFGDTVKKVAMLLSLAESPELIITKDNMQEAITVCEKLIGGVRKTTMGKEKDDKSLANKKALIINELMTCEGHKVSRTRLGKKYWMHFNYPEMDEIMQSFHDAGMIKTSSVGNEIIYEMPESQVQELRKYLEGK